jgi:hypothetical protein
VNSFSAAAAGMNIAQQSVKTAMIAKTLFIFTHLLKQIHHTPLCGA